MPEAIYDHPEISRRYFFPEVGAPLSPMDGGECVRLDAEGLMIEAYHHHPLEGAPTTLYLHGNGERVAHQLQDWPGWAEAAGTNMLFVDYPGYGASEGDPSLSSCRAAARAALAFLLERPTAEVPFVLLAGRSVGSVFALDAARQCPQGRLGGLWLESAVADVVERLALRVPYEAFALNQQEVEAEVGRDFDHRATLAELGVPISVVHARDDSLVLADNAERLASWGPEQLVELTWLGGDHNTIQWLNAARYPELLGRWVERAAAHMGKNG